MAKLGRPCEHWTEEQIEAELQKEITARGRMPTWVELWTRPEGLKLANEVKLQGITYWQNRMGVSVKSPRATWTEALVESELRAEIQDRGRMPTPTELGQTKKSGLRNAIQKYGGFAYWRTRLGAESKPQGISNSGIRWTEENITKQIKPIIELYGRMPTIDEMDAFTGDRALGRAIIYKGGVDYWAQKLGTQLKNCTAHRGHAVEEQITNWLRGLGFHVVRQGTLAPYDLLIDHCIRVNVKSSLLRNGDINYLFRTGKQQTPATAGGHQCDLYLCCGIDKHAIVLWRAFIPASAVPDLGLSLPDPPQNSERWAKYLENVDELRLLISIKQNQEADDIPHL